MKNFKKFISSFLISTLLFFSALSGGVQSYSLQGNPGSTIQGGSVEIQGGSAWSAFKVGQPIVLLDAGLGVSRNGSGADLIDEDFTTNPSWTNDDANNSSVTGGKFVAPLDGGVEVSTFQYKAFASQTECWASFDFRVDAGFAIPTVGHRFFGTGIGGTGGGSAPAIFGVINSGGTLKFEVLYKTDLTNLAALPSTVFTTEKTYNITMHWKAATAPAADDGILQVWVDTVLEVDLSTIDSDTLTAITAKAGGSTISSSVVGTIRIDNFKVGTTGASPAQVTSWADQSGNGNDLVQATAVDQPLWIASDSDFNGNPSVSFDGLTEFLQSANFTGGALTQPTTRIFVYKFINNVGAQAPLDSNSANRHWFRTSGTTAQMMAGTNQNIHTEDTSPHVLALLFNTTASNSWRDGALTTPAATVGTQTLTGERIGSRVDPLEYANIKVVFNAIYNKAFTAAELNYLGNGLAARFGTTWTDI